jgi:hypothetical protein
VADGGDLRADAASGFGSDAAVGDGAVAAICQGLVPDTSLLAYYRFDEGSGTAVHDCSGHGLDGVLTSGSWVAGHTGSAVHYNGSSTCIDLGTPAVLDFGGPFTITAWTKVEEFDVPSSSVARFIVAKTNAPTTLGWRLGTDTPPQFELKIGNGTGAVQTQATGQVANVWTHVAATFEAGKNAQVFVNGVRVVDMPGQPAVIAKDPSANVRIGCRRGDSFFKGIIDELRIYDRVLGASEITALAK